MNEEPYPINVIELNIRGWSLHTDTTPPQPNHNVTPTHIKPEQYNQWNNSTNKSQAPDDGCINIRNLLSIKKRNNKARDIKLVSLYSPIKMMHGPINIRAILILYIHLRIDLASGIFPIRFHKKTSHELPCFPTISRVAFTSSSSG